MFRSFYFTNSYATKCDIIIILTQTNKFIFSAVPMPYRNALPASSLLQLFAVFKHFFISDNSVDVQFKKSSLSDTY